LLLSLLLAACEAEPDLRRAPFGVMWGADTATAHRVLSSRAMKREPGDAANDVPGERQYRVYAGGGHLGVGDWTGGRYRFEFRRNALVSAGVLFAFADSSEWREAIDRVTAKHDEVWTAGRSDQPREGKIPGTYRIWLPVDSVSTVIWFERPRSDRPTWLLDIGYDRLQPEQPVGG
jgi:hypothetical protein